MLSAGVSMIRTLIGLATLALLSAYAPNLSAQASACDKSCQQAKLDDLFKRMDEASAERPKPSDSRDCTAYKGTDAADPLVDICAKLKFVRSLPAGADTRFSCPKGTAALIGLPVSRIREAWGEPDFREEGRASQAQEGLGRWTYFIGSPKPGWKGGGFPEVSLYLVKGNVEKVRCALSK